MLKMKVNGKRKSLSAHTNKKLLQAGPRGVSWAPAVIVSWKKVCFMWKDYYEPIIGLGKARHSSSDKISKLV